MRARRSALLPGAQADRLRWLKEGLGRYLLFVSAAVHDPATRTLYGELLNLTNQLPGGVADRLDRLRTLSDRSQIEALTLDHTAHALRLQDNGAYFLLKEVCLSGDFALLLVTEEAQSSNGFGQADLIMIHTILAV